MKKLKAIFSLFTQKEEYEEVRENIESNIPFKGTNLWILIFAVFIASLGLNVNSTAVIIGAMLISPLMGPIMGVGFAVAVSHPKILRKSIVNFFFATVAGLVTSTLYFFISPLSEAHSEILARTAPNIYDVLIAFVGGCAGMLANGSKLKGNVIPGVAIATALMPPLCTAGFGLATGQFNYFFGAFYLYTINSVFIAVATFIMVKILQFPDHNFTEPQTERKWKIFMWVLTVVTLIPSIWFGYQMILKNNFEQNANRYITSDALFPNNFLLSKNISFEKNEIELTYGGERLTQQDFAAMIKKGAKYGLQGTKITIKQGFNFTSQPNTLDQNRTQIAQDNMRKVMSIQDSITNEEKRSREIFDELRLQDPEISGFSFTNTKIQRDSVPGATKVALVISTDNLNAAERENIENFLRIRLKDPETNVIFESETEEE